MGPSRPNKRYRIYETRHIDYTTTRSDSQQDLWLLDVSLQDNYLELKGRV